MQFFRYFIHKVFHTKTNKGHNSSTTRLVEEKNTGPIIFHVHATYVISRSSISGSRVSQLPSVTDRRTDGQAQTNMPPSTSPKLGA